MRTNYIPALVTLSAGAVYCAIALYDHIDSGTFVKQLLLVLVLFFVVGCIAQSVADKFFNEKKEEETAEADDPENPSENADQTENIEENSENAEKEP